MKEKTHPARHRARLRLLDREDREAERVEEVPANPVLITIEENAVYNLDALEQALAGSVSLQTFLANAGLGKTGRGGRLYQSVLLGHEYKAAVQAHCENRLTVQDEAEETPLIRTGRRGRPRKDTSIPVTESKRKKPDPALWQSKRKVG